LLFLNSINPSHKCWDNLLGFASYPIPILKFLPSLNLREVPANVTIPKKWFPWLCLRVFLPRNFKWGKTFVCRFFRGSFIYETSAPLKQGLSFLFNSVILMV